MTITQQVIFYASFEEYHSHYDSMKAQGYIPYYVNRIPRTGQIKVTWKIDKFPQI